MDKPAKRIFLCLAHMSEDGVELTTSRMPLKLASKWLRREGRKAKGLTEVHQPTQRVSAEAKLAWTMPSRKEENEVNKAFDDNYVVPLGPNVNQFEAELETFVGPGKRVVALSCGTAAVHLALINCGVKAGDEVLVQSFTFCASSHPITYLGAKPVFVGSEKDSWNRRTSERNVKLA